MMDAFVKWCERCNEPLAENKRGRTQRFCSDRCGSAPETSAFTGKRPEIPH